ncbi:MAG: RteC domain-containing protein [Alistipes sp.]|nr:RteC domain-containing protein [Alistipes sp.]
MITSSTKLFRTLATAKTQKFFKLSESYIESAYSEFVDELEQLVRRKAYYLDTLRNLYNIDVDLDYNIELICKDVMHEHRLLQAIIKRLKSKVQYEIQIANLRMNNPELDDFSSKDYQSPLHWDTTEYTQSDLMELISGFYELKVLRCINGKPASLNMLVQEFQKFVNLKITNSDAARCSILNRKKEVAKFTGRMASCLVERSQL